jgi:oligoribonuclease (3'-5' exoribonuclease)
VAAVAKSINSCVICRGVHKIYACEKFKRLQVKERIEIVKTKGLCFNCLNMGHVTVDCRWTGCQICGKKHNVLLHLHSMTANQRDKNSSDVTTLEATTSKFNGLSHKVYNSIISSQSVLSTAIVYVKDNEGRLNQTRALLNSGAQSIFIIEKLARSLQLPRDYINITVETLNQIETRVKYSITAEILSRHTNYHEKVQFLILPTICNELPNEFIH